MLTASSTLFPYTTLFRSDFSNGNDGIVLKGKGKKLEDLKGQKINLVELSVSHYLLVRALGSVGMRERDVKIVNTSDAEDRKSTRLNSSHANISYAVFCLK